MGGSGSEVIGLEISRIADPDRRAKVERVCFIAKVRVTVDRALELGNMGFRSFDALHIACAERGLMLTTDDKLLRKAIKSESRLKVRIENPVRWLMDVFGWTSEP